MNLTDEQKRGVVIMLGMYPTPGAFEEAVRLFELYLHKKGGIYRKLYDAKHTDGGEVVVYEHIWPHEKGIWVRPKAEFEEPGRFVRIHAPA
jgi:hypothetical protein